MLDEFVDKATVPDCIESFFDIQTEHSGGFVLIEVLGDFVSNVG